jgi:photosystem II stability/assembly factor-like uncharacterized protein
VGAQPGVQAAQSQQTPARTAQVADSLEFADRPTAATADGQNIWRVGIDGIERSTDKGRMWIRDQVPDAVNITAGSAPSASVCWMVGRSGLVLRYVASSGWARTTSPAPVDFVAVSARDAERAVVTAADGRRFETADGGRTWRPVRP